MSNKEIPGNAQPSAEQWVEISEKLARPFPVKSLMFRPLSKAKIPGTNEWGWAIAAYIDRVDIFNRLDKVVGAQNWAYDIVPLVQDTIVTKVTIPTLATGQGENRSEAVLREVREITRAKGVITIHGVSKSAIGESSNTAPSKGCDADCVKRAAVPWGIGRYLSDIPKLFLKEKDVNYGRISDAGDKYLRHTVSQFHQSIAESKSGQEKEPQNDASNTQRGHDEDPVEEVSETTGETNETMQGNEAWNDSPAPVDEVSTVAQDRGGVPEATPEQVRPTGSGNPAIVKQQAIADYAKAVVEKKLPTGTDWEEWERYAVSSFLKLPDGKIDAEQPFLPQLTTAQIKNVTTGIRNGHCLWPWPDAE